jgi:SNF2 family DNA or RNA helicase
MMAELGFFLDRSEPGTGKTLTSLTAARIVRDKGPYTRQRILIVVPTIVREQWYKEARGMFPDSSIQVIKTGKDRVEDSADIIIVTYGIAKSTATHIRLVEWQAEIVIFDEAHALKNISAVVTKKMYGNATSEGVIKHAKWVWPLTGTPIRRWPDDLYPMFSALFSEHMKQMGKRWKMTHRDFIRNFCETELRKYGGMRVAQEMIVGAKNVPQLTNMLEAVSVKRYLRDMASELPAVTYSTLNVPVDEGALIGALLKDEPGLMDFYRNDDSELNDKLKALLAEGIDGSKPETYLATVRAELARQKATSPEFLTYLRDLDEPVIVFAWHVDAIEYLASELDDGETHVEVITGNTKPADRQAIADAFNDGDVQYLIAQIAAAGTGINLQENCSHVIFLEEDWSPAMNQQAIARVNRMGQQFPVHVERVIGDSFIDHAVYDNVAAKQALTEEIG